MTSPQDRGKKFLKNKQEISQEPSYNCTLKVIDATCEEIIRKQIDYLELFVEIRQLLINEKQGEFFFVPKLLKIVRKSPSDLIKVRAALTLINECLNNCANNYGEKMNDINNYVSDETIPLAIQKIIVESIEFAEEYGVSCKESKEIFMYFSNCYRFEAVRKSREIRRVLTVNFRNAMNHALFEKEQNYFLKEFTVILSDLNAAKMQAIGIEILQDLSRGIKVQIASEVIFSKFIYFHDDFIHVNTTGICTFFYALELQLNNKEYKKALKFIRKSYPILTKAKINRIEYLQIRDLLKTIIGDTKRANYEPVLRLISYLRENRFEKTSDSFQGFYVLIYEVLSFISKVKNSTHFSVDCCGDAQRHHIFDLCYSIIIFATCLVKNDFFTLNNAEKLITFVKYLIQILEDLKCRKKPKFALQAYKCIHNLLFLIYKQYHNFKPDYAELIHTGAYAVFSSFEMLPKNEKKDVQNLVQLVQYFGNKIDMYNPEQVKHIASVLTRALICLLKNTDYTSEREKRSEIMRNLLCIRDAAMAGGFESATEFIVTEKFDKELEMTEAGIYSHEIVALTRRYPKGTAETTTLFEKFYDLENIDFPSASLVAQVFSDKSLVSDSGLENSPQKLNEKGIKITKFKAVHDRLQTYSNKQKEPDIVISLALACNYYSLFNHAHGKLMKKFIDLNNEKSKYVHNTEYCRIVEELKFDEEMELIELLSKSIENFAVVVKCIQNNSKEAEKIVSDARIQKFLENISIIFRVRGIEYMELEAQIVLWRLFMKNATPLQILRSGTIVIENACESQINNIKLTANLENLNIKDLYEKTVDTYKRINIEDLKEKERIIIINYVLSMWNYHLKNLMFFEENCASFWWNEFERLWDLFNFRDKNDFKNTFEAKLLIIAVEIFHDKFNTTALQYLYASASKIIKSKAISPEFYTFFQQIYSLITTKAIQYSLNRHMNLDQHKVFMLSLKQSTLLNGYYMRSLEYLSLSIMRNLNMEKLDLVKTELRELFVLLGIEDKISKKENPQKGAVVVTNLQQIQQVEVNRRDACKETEILLLKTDNAFETNNTKTVVDELKGLIHDDDCKCKNCQFPILKFYTFQLACYYARLFWLMGKNEISKEFNDFAYERWKDGVYRGIISKVNTSILDVKVTHFVVFSIRWLFHAADTLVQLKIYDQVETIYSEIELICTPTTPDCNCIHGKLKARREFLNVLKANKNLENIHTLGNKSNIWRAASFEEFLVRRTKASEGREIEIKLPKKYEPLQTAKGVKSHETKITQTTSSGYQTTSSSRVKKISPTEKLIIEAFSSIKISPEPSTCTSKKTSSIGASSSKKKITTSTKTAESKAKKQSQPKDDGDVIYIDDSSDDEILKKPLVPKKKTTTTVPSSTQSHSTRSRANNISRTPKTTSVSTQSRRIL